MFVCKNHTFSVSLFCHFISFIITSYIKLSHVAFLFLHSTSLQSQLLINPDNLARVDDDDFAAAFARIECHYFVSGGFFECEGQLLRDVWMTEEEGGEE
jgi:hypothetical protein